MQLGKKRLFYFIFLVIPSIIIIGTLVGLGFYSFSQKSPEAEGNQILGASIGSPEPGTSITFVGQQNGGGLIPKQQIPPKPVTSKSRDEAKETDSPTPTPTKSPSPTPTASPSPSPTPTVTPSPTPTPTPQPTPANSSGKVFKSPTDPVGQCPKITNLKDNLKTGYLNGTLNGQVSTGSSTKITLEIEANDPQGKKLYYQLIEDPFSTNPIIVNNWTTNNIFNFYVENMPSGTTKQYQINVDNQDDIACVKDTTFDRSALINYTAN